VRQKSSVVHVLGVIACLSVISAGCKSGDSHPRRSSAAHEPDAGTEADAAGPNDFAATLVDLVREYDRQVSVNCPCYVEMGAYASTDDCVEAIGPGDDWVQCAAMAGSQYDSAELRASLRGLTDMFRAGTDCLSMTSCDAEARAACSSAVNLAALGGDFVVALATKCPDITLIPTRQ
jgi:hypothetical protein